MEVHHQSHTARKKWTHYFWEFLMLFLAVFCGFLAENFREHLIENQREKKYIHSLIADLKGDTAEIKSVIDFNIIKLHGMDTLAELLNKETLNEDDEKQLYVLNRRYAANIYTMIFNERTMRQLLSSGNLRLVNSQSISDSIMNYYGQSKDNIIGQEKAYDETSRQILSLSEDIFDKSAYLIKMKADSSFYRDIKPDKMKLMTRERNVLKKYAQKITTARDELANYLAMLFEMRTNGNSLLIFLQTEYHMK